MTAQEFQAKEASFLEAFAAAANVMREDVSIRSVTEITQRRSMSRALLATSVDVQVDIKTADTTAVMSNLRQESLTAELEKQGLPAPSAFTMAVAAVQGPAAVSSPSASGTPSPKPPSAQRESPDPQTSESGPPVVIIVAACSGLAAVVLVAAGIVLMRKARTPVIRASESSDIEGGKQAKLMAVGASASAGAEQEQVIQDECKHSDVSALSASEPSSDCQCG